MEKFTGLMLIIIGFPLIPIFVGMPIVAFALIQLINGDSKLASCRLYLGNRSRRQPLVQSSD